MNEEQLKKLLMIVGAVILIAGVITLLNSFQGTSSQSIVDENIKDNVDKIQIDNATGSIVFDKKDASWYLGSVDADQQKVTNLIDTLIKSKKSSVASTNSSNYSLFEVDDQKGIGMALYHDQSKLVTLIIGKSTTNGNYIRIQGDTNVYLVNESLNDLVSGDLNSFKDKTLSKGDADNLTKIITKDYQIDKADNVYKLSDGSSLDQAKTLTFVNNLINMNGYDVATDDETKSIESRAADLAFDISFNNGSEYKFEIYKIDEDNYFAKRLKDGVVVKLYKSQFDNVAVDVLGFRS